MNECKKSVIKWCLPNSPLTLPLILSSFLAVFWILRETNFWPHVGNVLQVSAFFGERYTDRKHRVVIKLILIYFRSYKANRDSLSTEDFIIDVVYSIFKNWTLYQSILHFYFLWRWHISLCQLIVEINKAWVECLHHIV